MKFYYIWKHQTPTIMNTMECETWEEVEEQCLEIAINNFDFLKDVNCHSYADFQKRSHYEQRICKNYFEISTYAPVRVDDGDGKYYEALENFLYFMKSQKENLDEKIYLRYYKNFIDEEKKIVAKYIPASH